MGEGTSDGRQLPETASGRLYKGREGVTGLLPYLAEALTHFNRGAACQPLGELNLPFRENTYHRAAEQKTPKFGTFGQTMLSLA